MLVKTELKGTVKEMSALNDKFNVRYSVRIDVDRFIVHIRVDEGFKIGKTRTINGLVKKLRRGA